MYCLEEAAAATGSYNGLTACLVTHFACSVTTGRMQAELHKFKLTDTLIDSRKAKT